MIIETAAFPAWIDGRVARAQDLSPLAFSGFAHFTAMQVRGGKVRGVDLHLARLRAASLELFGRAMPDDRVRLHIGEAIRQGPPDISLTATFFSRRGDFSPEGADDDPAILVRTAPPSDGPDGPLRLAAVRHERPLAGLKIVGEAPKTYYLRQAVRDGYDDAAFIDEEGRLGEATIWNLVFWDGEALVWPRAAILPGITMAIIRRQLAALGMIEREGPVRLDDLGAMKGAAIMNSWTPAVPVTAIGAAALPAAPQLYARLREAYEREPWDAF